MIREEVHGDTRDAEEREETKRIGYDLPRLTGSAMTRPGAAAPAVPVRPAQAGDAARGARLFRVQCAACHSTEPGRNKVGPSLAGVYGRAYGAVPGYRYPPAAGTRRGVGRGDAGQIPHRPEIGAAARAMPFAGLRDPAQRADIVAYLRTLK